MAKSKSKNKSSNDKKQSDDDVANENPLEKNKNPFKNPINFRDINKNQKGPVNFRPNPAAMNKTQHRGG